MCLLSRQSSLLNKDWSKINWRLQDLPWCEVRFNQWPKTLYSLGKKKIVGRKGSSPVPRVELPFLEIRISFYIFMATTPLKIIMVETDLLEHCEQNHKIIKSRFDGLRKDLKDHLAPAPCHGQEYLPSFLRAPSKLDLNTSRHEESTKPLWTCARASPKSKVVILTDGDDEWSLGRAEEEIPGKETKWKEGQPRAEGWRGSPALSSLSLLLGGVGMQG